MSIILRLQVAAEVVRRSAASAVGGAITANAIASGARMSTAVKRTSYKATALERMGNMCWTKIIIHEKGCRHARKCPPHPSNKDCVPNAKRLTCCGSAVAHGPFSQAGNTLVWYSLAGMLSASFGVSMLPVAKYAWERLEHLLAPQQETGSISQVYPMAEAEGNVGHNMLSLSANLLSA